MKYKIKHFNVTNNFDKYSFLTLIHILQREIELVLLIDDKIPPVEYFVGIIVPMSYDSADLQFLKTNIISNWKQGPPCYTDDEMDYIFELACKTLDAI